MAGGELWGVWAQTITNDTTAANVEKYGEIEDMAEAYRDGFAKDFCDGQTSPTPPRWPDDGMQLLYFYDRESAELVSQFLRGDIDERIAAGMLNPTAMPSWSMAQLATDIAGFKPFTEAREMEIDPRPLNTAADEWIEGLSAEQREAFRLWSGEFHKSGGQQVGYQHMNDLIRSGLPLDAHTQNFLAGLESAPRVEGIVYRGIRSNPYGGFGEVDRLLDRYRQAVGTDIVWDGAASASLDPSVATNFGPDIVFEIQGKSSRWIGPLSENVEEQEAIFPPGSRFTIVGVSDERVQLYDPLEDRTRNRFIIQLRET
jgi:hypothetical protein